MPSPSQDGAAYGKSRFGEDGGMILNTFSLKFLLNVNVEMQSEPWSLQLEKIGRQQHLGGIYSLGWMTSLTKGVRIDAKKV